MQLINASILALALVFTGSMVQAESLRTSTFESSQGKVQVVHISTVDGVGDKYLPALFYYLKQRLGTNNCHGYNCADERLAIPSADIVFTRNNQVMTDGSTRDYYDLWFYARAGKSSIRIDNVISISGALANDISALGVYDGDLISCQTPNECFIRKLLDMARNPTAFRLLK